MVEKGWGGKHIITLAGRNEQNVNKKDGQMATDKDKIITDKMTKELDKLKIINALKEEIEGLRTELKVQRKAASNESSARLNEVERLLNLVREGEEATNAIRLKHAGFREAMILIVSRSNIFQCND